MPEGRLQRTRELYATDADALAREFARALTQKYVDIFAAERSIGPRGLDLRVRSVGDTLTP